MELSLEPKLATTETLSLMMAAALLVPLKLDGNVLKLDLLALPFAEMERSWVKKFGTSQCTRKKTPKLRKISIPVVLFRR